ncbi:MAG: efflux RND transporter periplasmic adaptor subunit [Hymenobacteraceae bacterium]|nr:efflux RND transporter periplasmic adaptor subunit [Hymenobacteraceae bacterium]
MKHLLHLLLLLFLLQSCGDKQESTTPTVEDISESVYASGVVKSRNQYQVFATVSGLIKEILVTEGDTVKKGDPLMQIVNETAQLNTESARIAAERAALSANRDKLNELRQTVEQARTKKAFDSAMMVRQQNLWRQQVGTRVELEQRELAYENSAKAYEAARARYNDTRRELEFAQRQSQKNLEISKSIYDDYTVKSDINGRVYNLLKEEGEIVNPQTPVAVIGAAEDFMLELQVDEYDIARVKPGQKVLLNMDSYRGQVFEAEVEKINPIMNERSKTFTVEAGFTKRPPSLYPNLTTEANIIIQTKKNALTIPRNYLVDENFVITEDEEKKQVKVGLKDYRKAEIESGLTKDDVILKPVR